MLGHRHPNIHKQRSRSLLFNPNEAVFIGLGQQRESKARDMSSERKRGRWLFGDSFGSKHRDHPCVLPIDYSFAMPPRRPRDASNTSFGKPRQVSNGDEPVPSPAPASGYRAMSPTSRYNHNLRVVRRRDPTIVAIFEKFDHVCLYHLTNGKWEKAGYEGATFLFER